MSFSFFLDPKDPFLPPDAAEADVVARVALALLFESGGLSLFLHKLPKTSSENRLMTRLGGYSVSWDKAVRCNPPCRVVDQACCWSRLSRSRSVL